MRLSQKFLGSVLGLGLVGILASCGETTPSESQVDAYGNEKIHIVVAARPSSNLQGLWICKGNSVAPTAPKNGYYVSIGLGVNGSGKNDRLTKWDRNKFSSNLTPVGEFNIGEMIGQTCADGMTERCMQLVGTQPWNNNTAARSIFIHGTTATGEQTIGKSASHGCVRMKRADVVKVYNYVERNAAGARVDGVNTGTKVYITNNEMPVNQDPCSRTDLYKDIEPVGSQPDPIVEKKATVKQTSLGGDYLRLKNDQLSNLAAHEKCFLSANSSFTYTNSQAYGSFLELTVKEISGNCASWKGKKAFIYTPNFTL